MSTYGAAAIKALGVAGFATEGDFALGIDELELVPEEIEIGVGGRSRSLRREIDAAALDAEFVQDDAEKSHRGSLLDVYVHSRPAGRAPRVTEIDAETGDAVFTERLCKMEQRIRAEAGIREIVRGGGVEVPEI